MLARSRRQDQALLLELFRTPKISARVRSVAVTVVGMVGVKVETI